MGCVMGMVTGMVGLIAYGVFTMCSINLIVLLLGFIGVTVPFVGLGTIIAAMVGTSIAAILIIGIIKFVLKIFDKK